VPQKKITPKNEYFSVIPLIPLNWLCIFPEPTVTGISYLDILEKSYQIYSKIWTQIFSFQRDGALPHFCLKVTSYINRTVVACALDVME
jgi:hypothetical protein